MIRPGFPGTIGRTPIIRIPSLSTFTGCNILGKAEFLNPGGSVKDRAALFMITAAEAQGRLKPGSTIVEGTAGNTGIGLALMARSRGYHCKIVMPSNQSQEKIDLLKTFGADVTLVAPAPFANPTNYYHVARELAEKIPDSFWVNQFENTANADAHYQTTAPEIWSDTQGQLDAVIMAAGTGGTIGGITSFLKEKNTKIQAWLADPMGSGLYEHMKHGNIATEGTSFTEGIGIMRLTANYKRAVLDDALRVTDQETVSMAHHVLAQDGLYLGWSAALNLMGAVKLAKILGKNKTIVTMLCDGGARYQSRLHDVMWLAQNKINTLPIKDFCE